MGVPGHFFQSGGTRTFFQSGGTRTFFSTLHGSLWLGKDKGSIMKSVESCGTIYINITMEINFSSKVYSKSLLKVGSLKGSVVYSLILDYQFCACVMRISGVP